MKKILSILGAAVISATSTATIISCTTNKVKEEPDIVVPDIIKEKGSHLSTLKKKIDQAILIKKSRKSKIAFNKLQNIISEAKLISKEEEALTWFNKLELEIDQFYNSKDNSNLESLKEMVEEYDNFDLTNKKRRLSMYFQNSLRKAKKAISENKELEDNTLELKLKSDFENLEDKYLIKNDDIYAVTENYIVTNKGIFLASDKVQILKDVFPNGILRQEVLTFTDNILVTTKGVFEILNGYKQRDDSYDFPGLEVFSKIEKQDILRIDSSLIITRWGAYDLNGYQPLVKINNKDLKLKLLPSDIICSNAANIVTKKGIFDFEGKRVLANIFPGEVNEKDIIGISKMLLVTTKGIYNYYNQRLADNIWTSEQLITKADIKFLSSHFVVTTKGTFNHEGKQLLANIAINDILKVNDNVIVTTKSIFDFQGRELQKVESDDEYFIDASNYFFVSNKKIYCKIFNAKEVKFEKVFLVEDRFIITNSGIFGIDGLEIEWE